MAVVTPKSTDSSSFSCSERNAFGLLQGLVERFMALDLWTNKDSLVFHCYFRFLILFFLFYISFFPICSSNSHIAFGTFHGLGPVGKYVVPTATVHVECRQLQQAWA